MLTGRQREVVQLFANGKGTKEAAHELGISLRTVDRHVADAKTANKARNVTHLVAMSLREGWIE